MSHFAIVINPNFCRNARIEEIARKADSGYQLCVDAPNRSKALSEYLSIREALGEHPVQDVEALEVDPEQKLFLDTMDRLDTTAYQILFEN